VPLWRDTDDKINDMVELYTTFFPEDPDIKCMTYTLCVALNTFFVYILAWFTKSCIFPVSFVICH